MFIGRFTAALRALVPGLAGMSQLPYGRVSWPGTPPADCCGPSAFAVLGYLAGSQYHRIEHYANYIGLALLVLIAVVLYVRHRRAGRAESSRADQDADRVDR